MVVYSDFQWLQWDKVYQRATESYDEAATSAMSFADQQKCRKKKDKCALYQGRHAITLIGWGTEDGVPYWTAVNSWGGDWPENNKAGQAPSAAGVFKIAMDDTLDKATFAHATDPSTSETDGWCAKSWRDPGAGPGCLSVTSSDNQCTVKNKCSKVFKFAPSELLQHSVTGSGNDGKCGFSYKPTIYAREEVVVDHISECCLKGKEEENTEATGKWKQWDTCLEAQASQTQCGVAAAKPDAPMRRDSKCKITATKQSNGECWLGMPASAECSPAKVYISDTTSSNFDPGDKNIHFGEEFDKLCDDPSFGDCWVSKGCHAKNICKHNVDIMEKTEVGARREDFWTKEPQQSISLDLKCEDYVVRMGE